jgi:hypothetical protein
LPRSFGIRVEHQGNPELGRLLEVLAEVGGQPEVLRHDADDFVAGAVDLDGAANDRWVGAEAAFPEAEGQHDDARTGAAGVFAVLEAAADERARAEDVEHVGGRLTGTDALGLARAGEVRLARAPGRDTAQAARRAVVPHLGRRHPRLVPAAPAAPDHHAPVRLAPRKRRQQRGADHAEDGGGRAEAEAEREDGDEGEARLPRERAQAVTDVLDQLVHGRAPVRLLSF